MKRPYPDIKDVMIPRYIDKLAYVRKFVRYWGVTTVDGVRVFNPKKYFYKNMDDSTVKLTRFLGMYSDLKNTKMKGVKKAWLYLNHRKDGKADFDDVVLARNLKEAIGTGVELRLILGPKIGNSTAYRYSSTALTGVPLNTALTDQAGAIAEVLREYESYWEGGYLMTSTNRNDIYKDILAKYVLLSSGIDFTVTGVNKTYTEVSVPYTTTRWSGGESEQVIYHRPQKVDAFEVVIKVAPSDITKNTDIVIRAIQDVNKAMGKSAAENPNITFMLTSVTRDIRGYFDESPDMVTTYEDFVFNDSSVLWHNAAPGSAYSMAFLREDALVGGILTLDEKIALIGSIIDTDFEEKSTDAWQKLVAVVIIVIVVYFSAGYGAAAAGSATGTYAAAVAVSITISTAAFAIAIIAAAAGALGLNGTAMALAQFLKAAAPLIVVASIISIYSIVQNLAKQGAAELAKKGGEELAKDAIVDVTIDNVMAGIKAQFQDLFNSSLGDISMEQTTKLVNMAFDAYKEQDMKDLQKNIKREEARLAEYAEASEQSKTRHLMLDLMKVQFNPLSRDYSFYDGLYDRPYEGWATEYHTGNIQATTINANWFIDKNRKD